MENEVKKTNNKLVTIVITILIILVLGLGSFIVYDKVLSKDNNIVKENNTEEQKDNNVVKEDNTEEQKDNTNTTEGECPFYKFDENYVLTDKDKQEIIESLDTLNAGFTNIDSDSMEGKTSSINGYWVGLTFKAKDNPGSTLSAIGFKVNNKFKVITAGSGFISQDIEIWKRTFDRICS